MFQSKKNIIAGRNPVTEALKSGQTIDKILMFKNASGDSVQEIRRLAKELNVPVQYVPNEKLNGLTNIQQRAHQVHYNITFESAEGKGTKITAVKR